MGPAEDAAEAFATCYTSVGPIGAFLEVFAELRYLTRGELDRRSLAVIELPAEPRWADMTNPAIVTTWGLDERISSGDDYGTCHLWAQQLFAGGFTGVLYNPRHDVGHLGPASVALFGDPGHHPGSLNVLRRTAIPGDVVDEAAVVYGFRVLPELPLLKSFDPFEAEPGEG